MRAELNEIKHETCYLLVGGADGALDVALRADEGRIAELIIHAKTGFGGMIWKMVAQMLGGAPLAEAELRERIERMRRSGLLPDELNLEPLVSTLIRMGKA